MLVAIASILASRQYEVSMSVDVVLITEVVTMLWQLRRMRRCGCTRGVRLGLVQS
jgi:hypothetical protein